MANTTVQTGNSAPANVRATKSTSSALVGTISNGTTVNVVRCDATWSTLQLNGTPAFIWNSLLTSEPTQNGAGLSTASGMNTAKCNGSAVNVRSSAVSGGIVGTLNKGDGVSILGSTTGSDGYVWYRIGTDRWVRGDFLAPGGSGGSSGGTTGNIQAGRYVKMNQSNSSPVNVRASTSTSSTCLGKLQKGTLMYCEQVVSSTWVKVRWGGKSQDSAYIMSQYLTDGGAAPSSKMQRAIDIGKSMAGKGYPDTPNECFDIGHGNWCVKYVSFLQKAAGCTSGNFVPNGSDLVSEAATFFRNKNKFYLRANKAPAVGDWVFFSMGSETYQHVGFIVAVSGSSITTVEGNLSSTVVSRGPSSYTGAFGSMTVYGFGTPTWA